MTFSPICLCGDMQSQHKMSRGGCRGDDCGCDRYEEDAQKTADTRAEYEYDQRHSTETAEPDTLSTSARLASARQELEQLRNRLDRIAEAGGRDIADGPDVDLPTRVAELRRGRKEATERALELAALVARVEQAAGIDRERDRGVDLADRVQAIRDGRAEAIDHFVAVVGERNVLASHQRYLCETCGARYGQPYTDHEHGPLTPVAVVTTRIEGQQ